VGGVGREGEGIGRNNEVSNEGGAEEEKGGCP